MAKYLDIAEILKKEIIDGTYQKEGKLPTEYELVARFGVSRQTLRQSIACLKNEGFVYQIQGSGTYISDPKERLSQKPGASMNVLVICSYISDYIFPSIIRGIEKELSKEGYMVKLAATRNKVELERKILLKILESTDVDGLIVEGTKTGFPSPNVDLYQKIKEIGIPIVFLHCSYPELTDAVVVGMDDKKGGYLAAEALIQQGCKRLGAIFKSDDRQGGLRYAGFCDAIVNANLELDSTFVRWYTTEDAFGYDPTVRTPKFQDMVNVDGLVCYNDKLALSVIRNFASNNLKLPKLYSFDGTAIAESSHPSFPSLGHKKVELGVCAAKKIISMMRGGEEQSLYLDWDIPQ